MNAAPRRPHVSASPSRAPESLVIARKSKSNLAFALACLPAERRRDMISFYAFCRIIDDIADDPAVPVDTKRATLEAWRRAVLNDGRVLTIQCWLK